MTSQSLETRVKQLEELVSQLNFNTARELRYGQPDIRPALATDLAAIPVPLLATPTAVFTKNNNTTMSAVTGMALSLAANSKYIFFLGLDYVSTSAADIKFDFNSPVSTGWFNLLYITTVSSATFDGWLLSNTVPMGGNAGSETFASAQGFINTTTAETLQLRAAQNTADVSDTTISVNSYMMVWKLPN